MSRDEHDGSTLDGVLAIAEQNEVVLEQPAKKCRHVLDLLRREVVCRTPHHLDHRPHAFLHRNEVPHGPLDVVEHPTDGELELGEEGALEVPVELEVHDGLARHRFSHRQDPRDSPLGASLCTDHRMGEQCDLELAGTERIGDGLDEKQDVGAVRLDDRSSRRIALAFEARIERVHRDRCRTSTVGEREGAHNAAGELLSAEAGSVVWVDPANERAREALDRIRSSIRPACGDQLEESEQLRRVEERGSVFRSAHRSRLRMVALGGQVVGQFFEDRDEGIAALDFMRD